MTEMSFKTAPKNLFFNFYAKNENWVNHFEEQKFL
jgi:hypothetical protein